MSVSKDLAKTVFLKAETPTSTRMGHVDKPNPAKMEFLDMKTSTSTRMGHVGEQRPHENEVFDSENVDFNEHGACRSAKTSRKQNF